MLNKKYKIHFIYSYDKDNATVRYEKNRWLLWLKNYFTKKKIIAELYETCNYNSNDVYYTYKEFSQLDKSDVIVILDTLSDTNDKVVQLKIKYANKLKQLGKFVLI